MSILTLSLDEYILIGNHLCLVDRLHFFQYLWTYGDIRKYNEDIVTAFEVFV